MRASVDIRSLLSSADWLVFAAVLAATFGAVAYGELLRRRDPALRAGTEASFLDLMLMGRRLTLPLFTATLVATWYGGIFGVTRIAFEKGIFNFVTQGLFWYGVYLLFAFVLVRRVRGTEALSLPELVGRLHGPRSARVSAALNLVSVLPVAYAISAGLFLQGLFGGSLAGWTAAGVAAVVLYCLGGGFRAVVFSDLVQFAVMCSAVALVAAASVGTYGGLDYLAAKLPASHFDPSGGESALTVCAWGFVALATLIDPAFYQRCFAADSERTARRGILLATGIWFLFDLCTTAGGMYARAALPDADPAVAYLVYALQLLPPGARGLFLAGVLATVLSTLDSYLFIAGATLSHDLAPAGLRGREGRLYLGIAAAGAASVVLAYFFEGNIQAVWLALGSLYASGLLLPMLYGYRFPGRLSDGRFTAACACGAAAALVWRALPRSGAWASLEPLYPGMAASALALAVCHFLPSPTAPRPAR